MTFEGLKVHKPCLKHSGIRRTNKQTHPRSPSATVLMHHRGIRHIVPQESSKLNTINANIVQQPLSLHIGLLASLQQQLPQLLIRWDVFVTLWCCQQTAKMSQCCFNKQMTRPIPNYTALWMIYIDSIFKADMVGGLIAKEIYRHVSFTKNNAAKNVNLKKCLTLFPSWWTLTSNTRPWYILECGACWTRP